MSCPTCGVDHHAEVPAESDAVAAAEVYAEAEADRVEAMAEADAHRVETAAEVECERIAADVEIARVNAEAAVAIAEVAAAAELAAAEALIDAQDDDTDDDLGENDDAGAGPNLEPAVDDTGAAAPPPAVPVSVPPQVKDADEPGRPRPAGPVKVSRFRARAARR